MLIERIQADATQDAEQADDGRGANADMDEERAAVRARVARVLANLTYPPPPTEDPGQTLRAQQRCSAALVTQGAIHALCHVLSWAQVLIADERDGVGDIDHGALERARQSESCVAEAVANLAAAAAAANACPVPGASVECVASGRQLAEKMLAEGFIELMPLLLRADSPDVRADASMALLHMAAATPTAAPGLPPLLSVCAQMHGFSL